MLAVKQYPAAHVDACRTAFRAALAVCPADPAVTRQMVVALEQWFVHRVRGMEGKDGNPMNEVRLIASSVIEHDGVFTPDSTIKWKPEASVLGLAPGDTIAPSPADVQQLVDAFLDEVTRTYR